MHNSYIYLALIAAVLFIIEILYLRVADHFNIIDKPNHRSSHTAITIRGGGIVFPIALILYEIFFHAAHAVPPILVIGILAISLISFLDDLMDLPARVRFLVHLLAVTALVWSLGLFTTWPVWLIIVTYILVIGIINAYNFMDGINGINGVYSLVCLASLWYLNEIISQFTDSAFIICPILAALVFLFFNFRKRAKCFSGDIGSLTVGFWICALILMAILHTGDLKYILLLSVYGIDAIATIIHRIFLKQNIFKAHRLHFYQILANNLKVPHLVVSTIYGIVQLCINIFILNSNYNFITLLLLICLPLTLIYVIFKFFIFKDVQYI